MRLAGRRVERPAAAPTAELAVGPPAPVLARRGLSAAVLAEQGLAVPVLTRRGLSAAVPTGAPAASLAMVPARAQAGLRPESPAAGRGAGPDSGRVWPLRFLPGQSASREPASDIRARLITLALHLRSTGNRTRPLSGLAARKPQVRIRRPRAQASERGHRQHVPAAPVLPTACRPGPTGTAARGHGTAARRRAAGAPGRGRVTDNGTPGAGDGWLPLRYQGSLRELQQHALQ